MERRSIGESSIANGFGGSPATRPDVHRMVSSAGSVAGLSVPFVGVVYGVIRVGYDQYYASLGLTPEVVGLSQAAIVSSVAVLFGTLATLVATWIMFGRVVYRLIVPFTSRLPDGQRSWWDWGRMVAAYAAGFCVAASPALISALVAGGAGFRLWASGAVIAGALALEVSWMLGESELAIGPTMRRVMRSLYAGPAPRVGLLATVTIAGALIVGLVLNFWDDATKAGRTVRATGRHDMGSLNVTVSPARVIPKADDPLGVCDGTRTAVLVGRHDDVSYVLMLTPGDDAGSRSEVVPLDAGDYAVATAKSEPVACNRKAP